MKKEICQHQLFSKLHNYFSTKSPALQYTFASAALVFEIRRLKNWLFVFEARLHLFNRLTQRLTVLTSTH